MSSRDSARERVGSVPETKSPKEGPVARRVLREDLRVGVVGEGVVVVARVRV